MSTGNGARSDVLLVGSLPYDTAEEAIRSACTGLRGHVGNTTEVTIQELADLLKGKPQVPQRQNLLQPQQFLFAVEAVSGSRALLRLQQPDAVVVVQGADRNSSQPRYLSNPVSPAHRSLHATRIWPDVTSESRGSPGGFFSALAGVSEGEHAICPGRGYEVLAS